MIKYIKTFEGFVNEEVSAETQNSIVIDCLEVLMQYQVYHWQVQGKGSFAKHKAFDEFTDAFKALSDSLVESMQGRYDIISIQSQPTIQNIEQAPVEKYTDDLLIKFEKHKEDFSEDGDLANIIDEMIAEITKLSYLLTLE